MDRLLQELGLDLTQGLEVLDGSQVAERLPSGDLPLVITRVAAADAATVRQVLSQRYEKGHSVTLWRNGAVQTLHVHDLNGEEWADYQTTLYLPPRKPSEVGETDPRRWTPTRWSADPLVEVMARLRAEGGCPWDREQTHQSLRKYLLEEAYEAVEAIDDGDPQQLCEELGDVLLQVVFHAQVAREAGGFDFHDIVEGITTKLVRRHPHVFGDVVAETAADVTRNWEAIKREEKGGQEPESALGRVSMALPALSRAVELQKRAAKVGFDWPDVAGPVAKVREELEEVLAAQPEEQEGEVGDLLFAAVNLARMLKIDPEIALGSTTAKFIRRFRYIEHRASEMGRSLKDLTLDEMDDLWEEHKRAEFGKKYGQKYPEQ